MTLLGSVSGTDGGTVALCVILVIVLMGAVFGYIWYEHGKEVHGGGTAQHSLLKTREASTVKKQKEVPMEYPTKFDPSTMQASCFACCDAQSHEPSKVMDPRSRHAADWEGDAVRSTEAAAKNAQTTAQKY